MMCAEVIFQKIYEYLPSSLLRLDKDSALMEFATVFTRNLYVSGVAFNCGKIQGNLNLHILYWQ